jgi:endoglycosylceramidase
MCERSRLTHRLGVEWAGVESIRGQYNQTYIGILKDIVKMCRSKGIYVMLDFHHDLWSEKYCGEGAPAWAALADPDSNFPRPLEQAYPLDDEGFPSEIDCILC